MERTVKLAIRDFIIGLGQGIIIISVLLIFSFGMDFVVTGCIDRRIVERVALHDAVQTLQRESILYSNRIERLAEAINMLSLQRLSQFDANQTGARK